MNAAQISAKDLLLFLTESNRIEGISYYDVDAEMGAFTDFLDRRVPTVGGLCEYVSVVSGARLRDKAGMNVWVGDYHPPAGGPHIAPALDAIVGEAAGNLASPFDIHGRYEALHPFSDGNGRSGRMLWAWQMLHHEIRPGLDLGFLHAWYYQSLSAGEPKDWHRQT